jgi:hypothetical protein
MFAVGHKNFRITLFLGNTHWLLWTEDSVCSKNRVLLLSPTIGCIARNINEKHMINFLNDV